MSKKKAKPRKTSSMARGGLGSYLRMPAVQLGIVVVVGIIVYLIAASGGSGGAATLARDISVEEAYQKYQSGTFVLDVRTPQEWADYHVPNTTLIPLDELSTRLNELPKDQEIVVICHSGNRSKQGRDILLSAGFNATSVTGGLLDWYANNYPLEGPVTPQ